MFENASIIVAQFVAGQIWGWWGVAVPGRQTPWGRRGLHLRLLRTLHAEPRGWMLICFCPLRIWSEINFGRCPRQRKRSLFWHQFNRQDRTIVNYSGFILYNTENPVPSNRNPVPKNHFQTSQPVEGWVKKYSGIGEARTTWVMDNMTQCKINLTSQSYERPNFKVVIEW